jgi:predicted phosphodiesterase
VVSDLERVAFIGDWHMNAGWAGRAIRYAADHKAQHLVHAGDFGYTFDARFLDVVTSALRAAGLRLWFVDGNHEDHPKLQRWAVDPETGRRPLTDRIEHLPRGYRWDWSGVRFLAMGGAYSVDRSSRIEGRSWWPQETITRRQINQASAQGPTDVLVAHDCPSGVQIPGIDDRKASWIPPADLARAYENRSELDRLCAATTPRVIVHGHYHTRYMVKTDLGYGDVVVQGLDCDGVDLDANVAMVELADLTALI